MTEFDDGKSAATVADLVESVEGLNLAIIQGEVLMVYPGLGVYLVLPKHGDATGELIVCCNVQGSIGRSGVQGGFIYEAGDDVLVAKHRGAYRMELGTRGLSQIGYILCAAPPNFMASAQGYPGANIHGESLDYFNQTVTNAFASTKQLMSTMRDLSYGSPNDVFGGDFVQYSPLHCFLTVCATKTSMGASPMALIEAFGFHDKVRITARNLEERGIAVEAGREPDEAEMLYYDRRAMSEREGMGAVGDSKPFTGEDGEYDLAEEDQLGVFRHTRIGGPTADGVVDALLAPVEEDEVHTVSGDAPVGKVSVRQTYDGRHETRAAGGIDHVKSVYIPVPEQTKPLDKDAANEFEPEKPYAETYKEEQEEDFYPFAATLENEEFDADTENFRNSRTKARPDYFRVMTREQLAEQYPDLEVEDAPRKLEAIDAEEPYYDEPPHIEEEDPVTEMKRRLYALESLIRQQDDGTVVISDGHGSEIRMYRGRITISAAADLELRPGRDCIELVPRRKVITAGEEVQLSSNEGKVRIKAETDLDMLAGNGGRGRVLVENRADSGVQEEGEEEPDPGGIVVRSKKDLRMVGADLYLGLAPPEQEPSDNGLSNSPTGTLIIDSRGGSFGLQGQRLYGRFKSGISLSTNNALMGMTGSSFTVAANIAQFATGPFTIGSIEEGSIDQVILDELGVTQEELESRGSVSYLRVAGGIYANDATLQGSVRAGSATAKSGAFGNASLTSGLYFPDAEAPEVTVDPFSAQSLSDLSEAYGNSVPDDLTDAKLLQAWFKFDKPEDVEQKNFIMQEMRWQAMLGVGLDDGATKWDPKPVKTNDDEDTYAYPGYGPDEEILLTGLLGKVAFSEYIVNK